MDLLELGEMELEPVGTWIYGMDNPTDRLKTFRTIKESPKDDIIDNSLKNKTLTVITALVNDYYSKKEILSSKTTYLIYFDFHYRLNHTQC